MKRQLFTACAMFIACTAIAPAAVRYVKVGGTGDGSTPALASGSIAAMCTAAAAGDTIKVATGTYTEASTPIILVDNISLHGGYDAATMTTSSPLTAPSIIDGQRARSGLRIGQTNPTSICPTGFNVAGFKFINCWAIGNDPDNTDRGGAIGIHWNRGTLPDPPTGTIANVQIENCMAITGGAAIWSGATGGTAPTTHRLTIRDSSVTSCTSLATATGDNTGGNMGQVQGAPGALWLQRSGGQPRNFVFNNVIKDCIGPNNGIVFCNTNSSNEVEIYNNLIYNCRNTRTGVAADGLPGTSDGAIIVFGGRFSSIFSNNTIVNCAAPNYLINYDTNGTVGVNTLIISNNIIANNTMTVASTPANDLVPDAPSIFVQRTDGALNSLVRNNLIFNNTGFTRFIGNDDAGGDFSAGAQGTLTVDPLFVNAAGNNYQLAAGSPAINAGVSSVVTQDPTPETVNMPAFDINGSVRPAGGAHDLGAYEVQPPNRIDGWNIY